MPKTLLEKIVFTIVMATIMVYGMIVYNVALNTGGVTNATFGCNFPMALCWQMFYCGPLSRLIFRLLFRRGEKSEKAE